MTAATLGRPARAVRSYFANRYPTRGRVVSRLYRRNEEHLRAMTRRVVQEPSCRRVLDLGCGDGVMLRSVLDRPLDEIVLLDLVAAHAASATEALTPCAAVIKSHVGDIRDFPVADHHADVVLILGVLDYLHDWKDVLVRTAMATEGCLLANVPRSDCLWHRLRRVRLAMRGIPLATASKSELESLLAPLRGRVKVLGDRFSWYAIYRSAEPAC